MQARQLMSLDFRRPAIAPHWLANGISDMVRRRFGRRGTDSTRSLVIPAAALTSSRLDYGNRPDWYRGRQLVRPSGYATDVITDEAIDELDRAKQDGRPFYLHVAYNAPHFGKGWDDSNEATVNVMQPRPEDLKRVEHLGDPLRRAFAAKVVGMDEGIGRLLEALERHDLDENTLVVFMTDHGGDPDYGGSNLALSRWQGDALRGWNPRPLHRSLAPVMSPRSRFATTSPVRSTGTPHSAKSSDTVRAKPTVDRSRTCCSENPPNRRARSFGKREPTGSLAANHGKPFVMATGNG